MSPFSNLKYKILGFFFRQRCEGEAFKASLRDTFADHKRASRMSEAQLVVEMERLASEKRALVNSARQLAEKFVLTNGEEDARHLFVLYQRQLDISRRLHLLSGIQQLLRNERDKRDAGTADVLRMQLLNRQHYRTKFGMGTRPRSSAVSRRAMKLHVNEEKIGDMRQELDEVLTKPEGTDEPAEVDPLEEDDKFAAWINALVSGCSGGPIDGGRIAVSDVEIESRLQALKSS